MFSEMPPEPGEEIEPGGLQAIGRTDRRWLGAPLVVMIGLAIPIAKPWAGGGDTTEGATPSPTIIAAAPVASSSAAPPAASVALPRILGRALPAAAEVVRSVDLDAAPWANELAADAGGAWAWFDSGAVLRADAASDDVTRIDLGATGPGDATTLGSRGITLAWSQVWASDPAHRGLARIDRDTEAVA